MPTRVLTLLLLCVILYVLGINFKALYFTKTVFFVFYIKRGVFYEKNISLTDGIYTYTYPSRLHGGN